ncbi:MAG: ABC transporter permease [Pyrinomonadaceae bacterium]
MGIPKVFQDQGCHRHLADFITALVGAGVWFVRRGSVDRPKIAVINASVLRLDSAPDPEFDFRFAHAQEEAGLRESVGRRELNGLLIIKSVDSGELVTYRDQLWMNQFGNLLTTARSHARLAELNLGLKEFETVIAPFEIATSYPDVSSQPSGRVEKVYAGAFMCLMILAIFACYQYQFTSITGEKHLRVTEQIVSAISPQVWMDGKILGISAIGLALIVVYGSVSLLISGFAWWLAGFNLTQLLTLANPLLTLMLLALALLGILFWNCFFAAIAATVDDPNTSSRSVLMFLPFLPVTITLAGLRNPDSTIMKVLGMFPITSPAALSARLVVGEVQAWEVCVALGLLLGTIWLLRRAAAKIFRLAMLMYGKEPSLAELGRWLYES